MIIIETFHTFSSDWRWRAVLVIGSTRTILTECHEDDSHFDEGDARQAGEEAVASHLKEMWRMS